MSKKLLFNLNKNVSQDYTYVKYTGTIVTATNTLNKPIKNAILKGDTKYRDIDTGEILDSFDGTKNLELVSVKMPVLQTMGKNLFDGIVKENDYVTIVEYDGKRCVSITSRNDLDGLFEFTTPIPCMKGLTLSFMIQSAEYCKIRPVFEDGTFGNQIGGWIGFPEWTRTSYEIPQNSKRLRGFVTSSSGNTIKAYLELTTIQIEEGSNATSHESYKTNILTTPEGVVLRKIDDTTLDELNVINENHIQRVGEFKPSREVLHIHPSVEKCHRIKIYWRDIPGIKIAGNNMKRLCNILNTCYSESVVGIFSHGVSRFYLLNVDVNIAPTPEDAIQWLLDNDVTILYELETPIIKTVDLSILDQDGNVVSSVSSFNNTTYITTSSETISPIFEGYIATKESVE